MDSNNENNENIENVDHKDEYQSQVKNESIMSQLEARQS